MRYKKLLNIILLTGSLCFISVAGYGDIDQVLIMNKMSGAEIILAIGSIALVIVTAIHFLTVRRLTSQSNRYLRINTVCSQINTQVQKRSQCETEITKIRLEEIRYGVEKKVIPEKEKRDLNKREEDYKKTITKTQNKIHNLEIKLERLERKLGDC